MKNPKLHSLVLEPNGSPFCCPAPLSRAVSAGFVE
jgi:hypothetical protein